MRYAEFRNEIQTELRRNPAGLTWAELKTRRNLPYERPCPEWLKRLENEIGLKRLAGKKRAHVWRV
ncbi:MAG TPA: hypothetical protein VKX17_00525 [Planctomycetota bacterium]|nr:hypothetical protein [Planctomycetota bacterium]